MDKLRLLEIFLATCDGGSFAAAAKSCGTDPSTVSKAIGRLEAQLALTLFQRSTRRLSITEAGRRYASTARRMMQELSSCERELQQQNDRPGGVLRITCAVCYGHLYLRTMLQAFCQRYPAIQLDLQLNDLHVDLIENDIDIALRTGYIKDSRLVARRLSPMDFLVCASPSYLAAHGIPACADEFSQHGWIGFRIKQTQQLQPIMLPDADGNYQQHVLQPRHITDDGEAMAQLCADGAGFAQLPHFLAKEGLQSGALVSLYPYYRPPEPDNGVFAIYPNRDYLPARVRVFLDCLLEYLEAQGEGTHHSWAGQLTPLVRFRHLD
ncbi:MAG: LysR family transcriptional regulator [Alkalimonas sp.]|nr:LysR family transcriptional regulator [Alkalimonas sp.]